MTNIWNSFFHQIIFIIISYYVAFYYLLLFIPFSICFMDFFFGSQMTMMMSNHYLKISHLHHLKSGIS